MAIHCLYSWIIIWTPQVGYHHVFAVTRCVGVFNIDSFLGIQSMSCARGLISGQHLVLSVSIRWISRFHLFLFLLLVIIVERTRIVILFQSSLIWIGLRNRMVWWTLLVLVVLVLVVIVEQRFILFPTHD
jgi:hypothetical protein